MAGTNAVNAGLIGLVFIAALVVLPAAALIPTSDYMYWYNFTIDASDLGDDLDQFPVYLYLSSSSGLGNDDLSAVFDNVGSSWQKIAITPAGGGESYYIEVEEWDAANEKAALWFAPALSDSEDNVFTLWYDYLAADNPRIGWTGTAAAEEVWDANFVGVWHMADSPLDADVVLDSTSNGNDGAKNGGMGVAAWGDVGMAQTFDGTDDYIVTTTSPDWNIIHQITIESYIFKPSSASGVQRIVWNTGLWTYGYSQYTLNNDVVGGTARINGDVPLVQRSFVADVWSSCSFSYSDTTRKMLIYTDGIPAFPTTLSGLPTYEMGGSNSAISISRSTSERFLGSISEVRISNIARSDEWIAATHLSNTDALVTWGDPGWLECMYDLTGLSDTIDSLGGGLEKVAQFCVNAASFLVLFACIAGVAFIFRNTIGRVI